MWTWLKTTTAAARDVIIDLKPINRPPAETSTKLPRAIRADSRRPEFNDMQVMRPTNTNNVLNATTNTRQAHCFAKSVII